VKAGGGLLFGTVISSDLFAYVGLNMFNPYTILVWFPPVEEVPVAEPEGGDRKKRARVAGLFVSGMGVSYFIKTSLSVLV
jgi:hypothetical protein